MPRPPKRRDNHQQAVIDDDEEDDDYGYRASPSFMNAPQQQQQAQVPDYDAYESDGGWSDDYGKDSDAYVESHSGRASSRKEQVAAEVFDATKGSKKRPTPKKSTSRKIASFFTSSKKDDAVDPASLDDEYRDSHPQDMHQQQQSNYYHNNYYHDPPSQPLTTTSSHSVVDQAADPVSRAALAAGYAAAEYDNDHTVTHEQMELEQQHQQFGSSSDNKRTSSSILALRRGDVEEAPDGKTFQSTALTEAETRMRYTLACLIIGLTLAVVIVAGLVGGILGSVVFSKNTDDTAPVAPSPAAPTATSTQAPSPEPFLTLPPTGAPTSVPFITNQALYDSIVAASPNGKDYISVDGTAQNLAFVSVQSEPDSGLDTARLLQRYAMRVFYYSTNGASWADNTGWETTADECSWYSTATDPSTVCSSEGALQTLELSANNVTGTLPDELSMLTGLTRLYIKGVAGSPGLTGSIPSTLDQLTNLSVVVLNDHQFASSLPESVLSAWSQLTVINIIGSGLTGSIPSSVGSLSLCSNFLLDSNELSGSFPSAIGSMTSLAAFGVSNNQLTGTLPALSISTMKTFNVSSNLLTGPLPSFSGMPSLVKLSLDGNAFSGSLDMCGSSATVVDCSVNCTCATCSCV